MPNDDRYLFAITLPTGATLAIAARSSGELALVDAVAERHLGLLADPVTVFAIDGTSPQRVVVAGVAEPPAHAVELECRTGRERCLVRNGAWMAVDVAVPTAVVLRDARGAEIQQLAVPVPAVAITLADVTVPEPGATAYAPSP